MINKKSEHRHTFSAIKKKKSNTILIVAGIYALIVLILFILSSVIENGRECFAVNPYWHYGPITLPCYFFDSLYKNLIFPTNLLLSLMSFNSSTYESLIIATVLNSIFIYFLIKVMVKLKSKLLSKLPILLMVPIAVVLLAIFWFIKPILIEEYCQNQAKKIVGNQWNKLYKTEGYEKQYADQIAWGFREQLKCEHKFRL